MNSFLVDKYKYILSLMLLVPAISTATIRDSHHRGLLSSLNLGFRYSSLLENRGIIFYQDFQIDPVLGLFLFDDRVEFLGDSIGYRDFIVKDMLRLRSRFVSISDKPLFPNYDSVRMSTPRRADTYEWSSRAELFLPGYNDHYRAEIDFEYAKDISVHHGNYLNLQTKVKICDFRVSGTMIEPNTFAALGWGDLFHNQYFYGPSAENSGFNNLIYGLWFVFPEEADRNYPIIQVTHFQVLGDYKNAEYAKNRSDGWLFSFIATYGVLD
jgi:hypothetical protein